MNVRPFETLSLTETAVHEMDFDLGVWFCGYEERSAWLVGSPHKPPNVAEWAHVEGTEDRTVHAAERNLSCATSRVLGGSPAAIRWDSHWRNIWKEELSGIYRAIGRPLNVFVDISSMPRTIYAPLLIEALTSATHMVANVVFSYVGGQHRGSYAGHQQLDGLRTIVGLEGRSRFERDPALILGLGFDGVLAAAIGDLFQLDRVACLYANPGVSMSAVETCVFQNASVLRRAEIVASAAVGNLGGWMQEIRRFVDWYAYQSDVIIVALGPKPQVVASVLCALEDQRLGFRMVRTKSSRPIDVGPDGEAPTWMAVRVNAHPTAKLTSVTPR